MGKILLLNIPIIISLLLPKISVGENLVCEKWVYEAIEKLGEKGLLDEKLMNEIKVRREELSRIDIAEIINIIANNSRFHEVSKEDLNLIDNLIEEFKYELLLLRIERLEKRHLFIEEFLDRVKINGNLKFTFNYYEGDIPGEREVYGEMPKRSMISGDKELKLSLTGRISPSSFLSLKLKKTGVWGGGYNTPTTFGPLIIDKAYLRLGTSLGNLWIGRIKFSFGPFGMLVDNSELEGLDGIKIENRIGDITLKNIIGRITSDYYPGTPIVAGQDNFITSRIQAKVFGFIIGGNYVYTGLSKEKGYSFDIEGKVFKRKMVCEWARFKPSPDSIFEDKSWTSPCFIINLDLFKIFGIDFGIGYKDISERFIPYFSRVPYYERELGFFITGEEVYNLRLSKMLKWFKVDLEHLYSIRKVDRKRNNTSVIRLYTKLGNPFGLKLEYFRYAKDRLEDREYDRFKLETAFTF